MRIGLVIFFAGLTGWLVYLLVPAVMWRSYAVYKDPEELEAMVKGLPGKITGLICGVMVASMFIISELR